MAGANVSETIAITGGYHYYNFKPGTGTATTDAKGMVTDVYYCCFSSKSGFVGVQQAVLVGTWKANVYTIIYGNATWWGNLRAAFK